MAIGIRLNDPKLSDRPAGRVDGNESAMAGFAGAILLTAVLNLKVCIFGGVI